MDTDRPSAGDLGPVTARARNVALCAAIAFALLALRRFATYHNETFDLAFYTRIVWGLGRLDLYQPLTGSSFWGLHLSPALFVLGLLGRVLPIVPMLLVVQAVCVAAAGVPLARIAVRRAGHPLAGEIALVAYLLYPTISTVATYEFHPGTLALLPLSLALDALDARRIRAGLGYLVLAATCREDVALIAAVTGLALALRRPHRAAGLGAFAVGTVWFALYMFVLAPRFLPAHGSLDLHYGSLGSTPAHVAGALLRHPIATLRAVSSPAKLLYAPRLLVPVAFLSLLAPRWLLPALVPFAINYLSAFPTAVQIQSHYASLAIPFIFASAAHGAGRLAASSRTHATRYLALAACAVALGTLHMQHRAGATPLSRRWTTAAFRRDARTAEAERAVEYIPRGASVAAPDALLAHLAERPDLERIPWLRSHAFLLLDTSHRARFGASQDLWRSFEEAPIRNALAGARYGLVTVAGRYLVFARGASVRAYARGRYVDFAPDPALHAHHVDVGTALTLAGYGVRAAPGGAVVTLLLLAHRPLPADLGLELGWGPMHPVADREDPAHTLAALPYDGLFSAEHVRVGEVTRTEVFVTASPDELTAGLYFGARRVDGSRLEAHSAHWTRVGE